MSLYLGKNLIAGQNYATNTLIVSIEEGDTLIFDSMINSGCHYVCKNSSDVTIIITENIANAAATDGKHLMGFHCIVERWGAGNVTIACESENISINGVAGGSVTLGDQYNAIASVMCVGGNAFSVQGDIIKPSVINVYSGPSSSMTSDVGSDGDVFLVTE